MAVLNAIVQERYGSPPEVLELREIDRPATGEDDLLVRVVAAGVDPGVWHTMAGDPSLMRLMGYGLRAPKEKVRGLDFAGVVETAGANVTGFAAGDEVFGTCAGSYAEYARARARRIAHKPANVTFEQAASVPASGYTAVQALWDKGEVAAGESVLVLGAGGGVGTFAVQIAKAWGAHVTGICSAAKADLVTSLGADQVVDYAGEDLAAGARYDVILELAGRRSLSHLRRALAPGGRLVMVGGGGGGHWLGGVERSLQAVVTAPFVRQKLKPMLATAREEDLETLRQLLEEGKLTPVVDRTFPISAAAEAVRQIHSGHTRGKIVIEV